MTEFTECPDDTCRLIAEIIDRYNVESTVGPVKHIATHCIKGHHYVTIEDDTWGKE